MPDPATTRLALYKTKSDGSELVSVVLDLLNNWDKLDAATGFFACTSTTRPASPYNGKGIRETDTGRFYVWNGAGWTELVTTSPQNTFFNSLLVSRGVATNPGLRLLVTGDVADRLVVNVAGAMTWGSGAVAGDVTLARTAAGLLEVTAGALKAGGGLFAYKTADTGRTATATSADPHLVVTLAANAVYQLTGELYVSSTDNVNGNVAVEFLGPAGVDGRWSGVGIDVSDTVNSGTANVTRWISSTVANPSSGTRTFEGVSSGSIPPVKLAGMVSTTTGGTLSLAWARSGSAGTVTLSKYSFMRLDRVA